MEELSLSHTWLDIPSEFPAGYQLARPCGTDQKEKTAVVILENHHEVNDMSIDIIGKEIIKNKGR